MNIRKHKDWPKESNRVRSLAYAAGKRFEKKKQSTITLSAAAKQYYQQKFPKDAKSFQEKSIRQSLYQYPNHKVTFPKPVSFWKRLFGMN